MYATLFLGLPVVGVWLYYVLLRAMFAARVASPPSVPLFFVFAAYGAVLQFFVSGFFRVWSAMHSLTLLGLFVVAIPWLFVQGLLWRRDLGRFRLPPCHHHAELCLPARPCRFAGVFLFYSLVITFTQST